ncbi:MAG: hypothetical protein P1U56_19750 [Saprospiraceae bacterium]|nr:hypothetical protein [Saprospiraceae bacterium]
MVNEYGTCTAFSMIKVEKEAMEKFSNNRTAYWNQIIAELLTVTDAEEFRFQYLEVGQLLSHGFSITQFKNNSSLLIIKIWNAKLDNLRFNKGVYNLDRLAIYTHQVEWNPLEEENVSQLVDAELGLSNWNGVVLDGLFCQLEIDNKKFKWNINEEMNDSLNKFISILRKKASSVDILE